VGDAMAQAERVAKVRRIEERILAVMELGGWCGFDED
jgi:hypothetical protein